MVVVISAIRQHQIPPFQMALKGVLRALGAKKSFITQITGSGVLAGTSDFLCQKFVEKQEKIDFGRIARFAGLVSLCIAPISYRWIHFIEKHILSTGVAKWKVALKRVAADQIVAAPLLTSLFLFNLNVMETRSVKTAAAKTSNILVPVISTNYKVWPFIQCVNLSIVPIQYRVLMVQFCGIFWNIYLSFMQHKAKAK